MNHNLIGAGHRALRLVDDQLQQLVERAVFDESLRHVKERIRFAQALFGFLKDQSVLDGNGRLIRQQRREFDLFVAELGRIVVERVEPADGLPLAHQWRGYPGAGVVAGCGRQVYAPGSRAVRHDRRLQARREPAAAP